MRPIVKWQVGDVEHPEVLEEFNPWSVAKPILELNLAAFCSYCEKPSSDEGIHIEHVQPKSLYPELKFKWVNFLFSCQRCNGMDNKGDKNVVIGKLHLPHTNNTWKSLLYKEGGLPVVHPDLNSFEAKKAQALIDLVGLDKREGHPKHLSGDNRAKRRRTTWELAEKYLIRYKDERFAPDIIADLAYARGFWSVWMTVFHDEIEVKRELKSKFEGTYTDCE